MDHYQALIKRGEPVVILRVPNYPTVDSCYRGSVGTWMGTYPEGSTPDMTTESLIAISRGENDVNQPIMLHIPDCYWLRIDPQSSLYKSIMNNDSTSILGMHQDVRIIDGLRIGKTGFINGIHVDSDKNEYKIRFSSPDGDYEEWIPRWCLQPLDTRLGQPMK